jgi:hemin uptake protein HemP
MNEPHQSETPPSGLPFSAAPFSHSSPGSSVRPDQPRDAWRSEELLGDKPEVLILHNNEVYRLRRTRQGKLILHK